LIARRRKHKVHKVEHKLSRKLADKDWLRKALLKVSGSGPCWHSAIASGCNPVSPEARAGFFNTVWTGTDM
jgi:hypothetical protein